MTCETMPINAAGLINYSGYAKKTQDVVSGMQQKETTGVGTNWVEYVGDNNKLVCWIQQSGSRITDTKSYTDSGYQKLVYNDPIGAKGKYLSLAVSTSLTTIQTTYTFGAWSPDDVQ